MNKSVNSIQMGIANYLDHEIVPMLKQKQGNGSSFAAQVFSGLYLANLPNILNNLKENPFLAYTGVFDEAGNINVNSIIEQVEKVMPVEGLSVKLPIIGNLSFNNNDVETLRRYIEEAN